MRINARNFTPIVKRVGIHTIEVILDGVRYRLTETEARLLANQLLKLAAPQGESHDH